MSGWLPLGWGVREGYLRGSLLPNATPRPVDVSRGLRRTWRLCVQRSGSRNASHSNSRGIPPFAESGRRDPTPAPSDRAPPIRLADRHGDGPRASRPPPV